MAPAYPQFCNGNGRVATQAPLRHLIDHIQKMTMAAMAIADMKVWAQRS